MPKLSTKSWRASPLSYFFSLTSTRSSPLELEETSLSSYFGLYSYGLIASCFSYSFIFFGSFKLDFIAAQVQEQHMGGQGIPQGMVNNIEELVEAMENLTNGMAQERANNAQARTEMQDTSNTLQA